MSNTFDKKLAEEQIKQLEEQLAGLKETVEKVDKVSSIKRYDPGYGDEVWYVGSSGQAYWMTYRSKQDKGYDYETGNWFETKEEAQEYSRNFLRYRKVHLRLKELSEEAWFEEGNSDGKPDWSERVKKWFLYFDHSYDSIGTDYFYQWQLRTLTFPSELQVKSARNTIIKELSREDLIYYLTTDDF